MSGHSKWHSIKHKKARVDAARGRVFTKLIKEVTVAARMGGGDPEMNPRLRTAIQAAKAANMPGKNIENGVKKGTGELPGVVYEEIIYEGYGPAGVAIYMNALTDNKNRTVAEIRHLLGKNGGNLGESGCVAWMFEKKGMIKVEKSNYDEEELFMIAVEVGAEDMKNEDEDFFEIYTDYEMLEEVREGLEKNAVVVAASERTMVPKNTVELDEKGAEQMLRLMEALDDHEDIQDVYANFDIDDEVIARIAG
ncbi:MAG: YebC/PmpR family DNA-binding transcriptional regulator [Calditrichales bacterium]|nr:MAG: YebC/PmpR family DNA-binding transcriptional regulator [Calditrichales bacterium]